MAYTLLFPFGSEGYQGGIPKNKNKNKKIKIIEPNPDQPQLLYEQKKHFVSPREFAAYTFMKRAGQENHVTHTQTININYNFKFDFLRF